MADITEREAPPLTDTSSTPDTTALSPGPGRCTEGGSVGVGGPTSDISETQADAFREKFEKQVKKLVNRVKHGRKKKQKEKPEVKIVEECTKDDDDRARSYYENSSTGSDNDGIDTQTNIAYSDLPDVWEWRGPESMLEDTYDFNHFRRGVAVLIVNTEFSNVKDNRPAAEYDIQNLTALFQVLGFEVKTLKNKTTKHLMDSLKDIRSKLEKDSDCFACLISTHGAEVPVPEHDNLRQHMLHTHDGAIVTDDIIKTFNDSNCAAMRGKPKLFFIQSCRARFDVAETEMVDLGVDIDITTDFIQPSGIGTGEERRHTSQHQGGSDTNDCASVPGHKSFDTESTPKSVETQETLEMRVDRIQITGGENEVLGGINFKNTTKADAKGRVDDNPAGIRGIEDMHFADDEEEHDHANEEEQRKIREAWWRYREKLQQEQEQKRRDRYLALQQKRHIEDADYCTIPCYKHCLVMFSSAPERLAWCDDHIGGWLPYCMYNVVSMLHRFDFRTDLLQVLTEVNNAMGVYLEANIPSKPEWHGAKSAPCIYHMLTKDIYFRLKWNSKIEIVTEV
ncbi:uncharacterized protein LOC110459185 [Mizuhopecten yessoensis]|uniref:Caspase-6 n=1 Tax=Mizuhopecten yessoensis TaxID=6573 RepID=A0A210Q532_MIZYE|nr:uncharacterized protein LOC110459185 [Mizuhopecten yessoensis]OWF43838.1 Caspase-6 [Mizuhopecten yessoensis]